MIGRSGTAVPVLGRSVTREVITGTFEAAEPKVEHTPETLAEPKKKNIVKVGYFVCFLIDMKRIQIKDVCSTLLF